MRYRSGAQVPTRVVQWRVILCAAPPLAFWYTVRSAREFIKSMLKIVIRGTCSNIPSQRTARYLGNPRTHTPLLTANTGRCNGNILVLADSAHETCKSSELRWRSVIQKKQSRASNEQ